MTCFQFVPDNLNLDRGIYSLRDSKFVMNLFRIKCGSYLMTNLAGLRLNKLSCRLPVVLWVFIMNFQRYNFKKIICFLLEFLLGHITLFSPIISVFPWRCSIKVYRVASNDLCQSFDFETQTSFGSNITLNSPYTVIGGLRSTSFS